jgi:hypothetical protein
MFETGKWGEYLANDEIIHPIGTSSQSNTIRTIAQRPNLSNNNPRARTPTVSEMDDEKPDHDHGAPSCTFVLWPRVAVFCNEGCDDDVGGCHPDCTDCENGLPPQPVDVKNRRDGGDEHDDADDAGCQERCRVGCHS